MKIDTNVLPKFKFVVLPEGFDLDTLDRTFKNATTRKAEAIRQAKGLSKKGQKVGVWYIQREKEESKLFEILYAIDHR